MPKSDYNDLKTAIEVLTVHSEYVRKKVDEIQNSLEKSVEDADKKFATKEEVALPRTMIYSFAGMILVAAIGAMIAIVIPKINTSSAYEVSQK